MENESTVAANRVRHRVIDMCAGPHGAHLGGAMSIVDILAVLYLSVMRVDPVDPADPDRDIFLLSKGHGAIALYAMLAERGLLPISELAGYAASGSRLLGHPVKSVPGVEMATGSLGHGLPLGLGFSLAARINRRPRRVFVLLGDGELQEGSCWEAIMSAAANRADQLVAIIDRNGLQLSGATEQICPLEPLADRFRSFGWAVRSVDGHDQSALRESLAAAPWEPGRPSVVIANTVKGYGVSYVAGQVKSHHALLSPGAQRRAHRVLSDTFGEHR